MRAPVHRRLATLVLSLALIRVGAAALPAPQGPGAGDPAPDFSARNLRTHDPVKLSNEQGRLVLLTFWASWCPPCRKELPVLEAVQRKLGPERAAVLAVSFKENDEGQVRAWAHRGAWQITLLEDPGGQVARAYAIHAIPHLFIIGPDGRIMKVHTGYGEHSIEELVADINAALTAAGPVPAAESAAQ